MNNSLYGSFVGYEQRTNVSRLFRIYATPHGLYFGWIADRDYEEMLARFAGHGIGQAQTIEATQSVARAAQGWEELYATMNVESAQFIEAHPENFAFANGNADGNGNTASVTWKLKWTEKAATRRGALDIVENGKRRRFYLVGQSTPELIAQAVSRALPAATIEPIAGATVEAAPVASPAGAPEVVTSEPVYKRPNWLLIGTAYLAAIGVSLWIAARFNFWIPLGACVVAPYFYKMLRFGGIAANYHKNTAEQLRRDRANSTSE